MKKIYLAGPDVFRKDALEYGLYLKELCFEYGFKGLFPLDNEFVSNNKSELAMKIKHANMDLIKEADIVLANLSPFRGVEPDSGTVWELGFAQGLGKKVISYSNDTREIIIRVNEKQGFVKDNEFDLDGLFIENFGLSNNLMLSDTIIANSFEDCLILLSRMENN